MSSARVEPARRVFFALWPQAGVREALDQAALAVAGQAHQAHACGQTASHARLCGTGFSGDVPVPRSRRRRLCRSPPFALAIDRIGHWPRPRILWAGPQHTPPALWSLVGQLRAVLAQCGIPPETRPYQAHITIARKLSRAQALAEIEPIDWSISQFSLVESVTDPAGVRYQLLRSWELEG